jgi:hypothetical protein
MIFVDRNSEGICAGLVPVILEKQMIKLTLRDIAPMIESLNNVMNLPLPAKESYRLGVAAKLIQDRITVYEKARQNLVAKYGEPVFAIF